PVRLPRRAPAAHPSTCARDVRHARSRARELRCGAPVVMTAPGLLAGLRVLDLSVWRPGPYATQLLAEIGADVIKVEPPGGDPMRSYPELFASLNANKRSVALDLKSDADRARALDLARHADVVIEGFRP